jgi:hypothetical protein
MKKQIPVAYVDAITYALTTLAILPYTLGAEANLLSPEWKSRIAIVGLIAGTILKAVRGHITPGHEEMTKMEKRVDRKIDKL